MGYRIGSEAGVLEEVRKDVEYYIHTKSTQVGYSYTKAIFIISL